MQPTLQDNQLMSKQRVLSFKPQLRLERRGQDGQNETEQPDHSASDSITSSTQIRFSVHTRGSQLFVPACRVRFRCASESKRYTHLLPRSLFCKLDIRPPSPVAPSQLSGPGSGLGRSSDTSLRCKEPKLHSRKFVDDHHLAV